MRSDLDTDGGALNGHFSETADSEQGGREPVTTTAGLPSFLTGR